MTREREALAKPSGGRFMSRWNRLFNRVGSTLLVKSTNVIPAKAGIQFWAATTLLERNWIPAFAGVTSQAIGP
jgi:hypothetical protein